MNNQLAAFSEDIIGRRIYTILLKNLETGEFLTDKIENTTGKTVWAADNEHFSTSEKTKRYALSKFTDIKLVLLRKKTFGFHEEDETF